MIRTSTTHNVHSRQIIDAILEPYRPECRHLTAIEYGESKREENTPSEISAIAHFRIEPSWYIRSTGHFNAVDAVLCFNQMGYACIDQYFSTKLDESDHHLLDTYRARRLNDMVIARMDLSFRKPITSSCVDASIHIVKARKIKSGFLFKFECVYYDNLDGSAELGASTVFVI
jgi:hypothetical protein